MKGHQSLRRRAGLTFALILTCLGALSAPAYKTIAAILPENSVHPLTTPPPNIAPIVNGGFENSTASPWVQSSSGGYTVAPDTTRSHTGVRSAYLCGYNNCRDSIYQSVYIYPGASNATLTYWWYVSTTETTHSYDFMHVSLRDGSGTPLTTLQTLSDGSATNGWHQASYNITAYRGKTVQVLFSATTDYSLPTSFFVDDVSLTIQ